MADIILVTFGGEHGVKGDSRRVGYDDGNHTELSNISMGANGMYDPYHQRMSADISTSLSFTMQDGAQTPPMMDALFKTHQFALVTFIILRREGSAVVPAMTIECSEAYLTSFAFSPSAGSGPGGDILSWSLAFDKMVITGKGNAVATWEHEATTA